jgi:ribonuclease Z
VTERMPSVTIVGSGEAFDPDLPNNSALYRGALTLLVDCGYAVPHAFWRISRDPSLLDAVYVTHLHADHSFGLPALLLWMKEEGRTRPLEVIGGPGIGRWLEKLNELAYPGAWAGGFPLTAVELAPGERLERGGATLSNAQSRHGVRNLALRIDEGGRSYCHSGDGAPSDATRALYRDATLLLHECYHAERESDGHARASELCEMAETLEVETLALVHLSRREKADIARAGSEHAGKTKIVIPNPGDSFALE